MRVSTRATSGTARGGTKQAASTAYGASQPGADPIATQACRIAVRCSPARSAMRAHSKW